MTSGSGAAAPAGDAQVPLERLAREFASTRLDPALNNRYVDRAFLSMMADALSGETEPVRVINKRLFREGEDAPLVDDIRIDGAFVTRLLGSRT